MTAACARFDRRNSRLGEASYRLSPDRSPHAVRVLNTCLYEGVCADLAGRAEEEFR
jgi:hypothetical protein